MPFKTFRNFFRTPEELSEKMPFQLSGNFFGTLGLSSKICPVEGAEHHKTGLRAWGGPHRGPQRALMRALELEAVISVFSKGGYSELLFCSFSALF